MKRLFEDFGGTHGHKRTVRVVSKENPGFKVDISVTFLQYLHLAVSLSISCHHVIFSRKKKNPQLSYSVTAKNKEKEGGIYNPFSPFMLSPPLWHFMSWCVDSG